MKKPRASRRSPSGLVARGLRAETPRVPLATMPKRVKDEAEEIKPELEVRLATSRSASVQIASAPFVRPSAIPRGALTPPTPAPAKDAVEAPPAGSEHVRSALGDFLAKRKLAAKLPALLSWLNPVRLRANAETCTYKTPRWADDNTTPPQLRAHWRAQVCEAVKCKESELPEPLTNALRTFLWPGALDTTRGEHRRGW